MTEPGKVHVGNLDYRETEDNIRRAFETYGTVDEVIIVTDRDTQRSRGYGFVTFADAQDAKEAINGLNETELSGRTIKVSESRPRREGGGRGRYSDRSYGDRSYGDRGGYGGRGGRSRGGGGGDRGFDDRGYGSGRKYGGNSY